jgi:DNA-binding MarR family transcriptional regulator
MSSERTALQWAVGEHFGRDLSAYTLLFHQAVADHLGLNVTDLKCLDLARSEVRPTPGRLAEVTGLTTAAITSILDRLEHRGFVRRERDPKDRRKILVVPEASRAEEVTRLFAPLDKAMTQLLAQYSTEELAFLNEFALCVGQILQQETARLRKPSSLEESEEHREAK